MIHLNTLTNRPRWSRGRKLGTAVVLAVGIATAAPTLAAAAGPGVVQTAGANVVGLKLGDRGESVRLVQERLIGFGFTVTGGADGIFGAGTERALKSFQRVNGLEESGVVTAPTARYLGITADSAPSAQGASSASGDSSPAATASSNTGSSSSGGGDSSTVVGLQQGSRGAGVTQVQQQLMSFGYTLVGGADGIFGPSTERALKSFQRSNGLEESGIVTAKTAQLLGTGSGAAASAPAAGGATSSGRTNGTIEGLQRGHRGDDVKLLQTKLTNTGLVLVGGVDGIFGSPTRSVGE